MHVFKTAKETAIPCAATMEEASAGNLWLLVYEMSEWLQETPTIHHDSPSCKVYVLFGDVSLVDDDFWETFGPYLARQYQRWPLDIFGTAAFPQETVWTSIEMADARLLAVQHTPSGRAADVLQALCLRITAETVDEAAFLQTLFAATQWRKGIVAMDRRYREQLFQEQVAAPQGNSYYCYGGLDDALCPTGYLQALHFEQKRTLWTRFLRDGFDDTEFEWLYEAMRQDAVENRVEWELALAMAMETLGYTVCTAPDGFEIYDGAHARCYFSVDGPRYAERAFLKILFPVHF